MNPEAGVQDGISIQDTTGLEDPWDEHVEEGRLDKPRRTRWS